jgi:hypothetical protein
MDGAEITELIQTLNVEPAPEPSPCPPLRLAKSAARSRDRPLIVECAVAMTAVCGEQISKCPAPDPVMTIHHADGRISGLVKNDLVHRQSVRAVGQRDHRDSIEIVAEP